jgi:hypothetical protein
MLRSSSIVVALSQYARRSIIAQHNGSILSKPIINMMNNGIRYRYESSVPSRGKSPPFGLRKKKEQRSLDRLYYERYTHTEISSIISLYSIGLPEFAGVSFTKPDGRIQVSSVPCGRVRKIFFFLYCIACSDNTKLFRKLTLYNSP